ncbi:MAG: hypothetical protein JWO74_2684 [Solirubrobacterales bacterium]|jgi:hypothetical protein|nr:hypothetical protein [Solirubrobacterales bacterium]
MSRRAWLRVLRFWLPVAICAGGLAIIVITGNEDGAEGGALVISAGLSVWLLNFLYRVSVTGDREREREEDARRYYDRHGYWPDEKPARRGSSRKP